MPMIGQRPDTRNRQLPKSRAVPACAVGKMIGPNRGMTLFELMVVVAVVAILVSIAYPSYSGFIRKAHRAEAQTTLLDWANRQENWRADHTSYNADFTPASTEYYSYSMASTATSFTLTANALNAQLKDKEKGVPCSSMNINEAGVVGPPAKQVCWRK